MEMSVEQVTNEVTSGMREESEAPDDGIGRVWRVRTVVAGLDRIREMAAQGGVRLANLFNRAANVLGDRKPRTLGMRRGSALTSLKSNPRGKFRGQHFSFFPEQRDSAEIVASLRLFEFRAQILETTAVLGDGLGIEHDAGVAQVGGNCSANILVEVWLDLLLRTVERGKFPRVELMSGVADQMRNQAERFRSLESESFAAEADCPVVPSSASSCFRSRRPR